MISGRVNKIVAVEITENIGMDTIPFIMIVQKHRIWEYDLVIKLHTKNTKSDNSVRMLRLYLDALITDHSLTVLKKSYESKTSLIGLWGPIAFARSIESLVYKNRTGLKVLESITGISCANNEAIFFAGNMFCIRGALLKKLSDHYFALRNLFNGDHNSSYSTTGADGSLAHSLERFFSYVVKSQSYNLGYVYPNNKGTKKSELCVVPEKCFPFSFYKRYLQAGSNDTSLRIEKIEDYRYPISNYDEIVDIKKYADFVDPEHQLGLDYLTHYLIFSDYLQIPIGIEIGFSSSMYRLERPDVFRAGVPSPFHYLKYGRKERPDIFSGCWAKKIMLRYIEEPIENNSEKITDNCISQFQSFGSYKVKTPAFLCVIDSKLGNVDLNEREISTYELFENYIPELLRTRDLLKLQIEHNDYIGIQKTAEDFLSNYFSTPDIVEILAVAYTLNYKWNSAKYSWNLYQQVKKNKNIISSFAGTRLIDYDAEYEPKNVFGNKLSRNHAKSFVNRSNPKICIYTSLFGDYDDLPEIKCDITSGVSFIAFTDRLHIAADKRWKQKICVPDQVSDNLSAKKYKIKPHCYLSDYDCSLFVDANTVFTNLDSLIDILKNLKNDFVMWRHPLRTDLYMEACAILASNKANPNAVINQLKSYTLKGIGKDTGLCEGSFIWRNHNNLYVSTFMNTWWDHITRFTHRDQLSLCFLMWKNNFYPELLDDNYGTSRENDFFYKRKFHKIESTQQLQA
jgi:hypothetical protein